MKTKYYKIFIPTVLVLISLTMLFIFNGLPGNASVDSTEEQSEINATGSYYTLAFVTCDSQGDISGDSSRQNGAIEVLGFSHSVVSPRDAASGLPTGKRQHKPITITKPVDKATPKLYQGLSMNENCGNVRLEFFKPDSTGKTVNFYSIELLNAHIVSISTYQSDGQAPREHVSFTYQKIIWTWEDGGITFEDDWQSPVA